MEPEDVSEPHTQKKSGRSDKMPDDTSALRKAEKTKTRRKRRNRLQKLFFIIPLMAESEYL